MFYSNDRFILHAVNTHCNNKTHVQIDGCCNKENPCMEGQGHCDSSESCINNMLCDQSYCDKSKFPFSGMKCCGEVNIQGNKYIPCLKILVEVIIYHLISCRNKMIIIIPFLYTN